MPDYGEQKLRKKLLWLDKKAKKVRINKAEYDV